MIKLFLLWLKKICRIKAEELVYELLIHESGNIDKAKNFWSKIMEIDPNQINVYLKKHKVTRRHNIGNKYVGLVKVSVRKSTDLNRRIDGWIESIYNSKYCGIV